MQQAVFFLLATALLVSAQCPQTKKDTNDVTGVTYVAVNVPSAAFSYTIKQGTNNNVSYSVSYSSIFSVAVKKTNATAAQLDVTVTPSGTGAEGGAASSTQKNIILAGLCGLAAMPSSSWATRFTLSAASLALYSAQQASAFAVCVPNIDIIVPASVTQVKICRAGVTPCNNTNFAPSTYTTTTAAPPTINPTTSATTTALTSGVVTSTYSISVSASSSVYTTGTVTASVTTQSTYTTSSTFSTSTSVSASVSTAYSTIFTVSASSSASSSFSSSTSTSASASSTTSTSSYSSSASASSSVSSTYSTVFTITASAASSVSSSKSSSISASSTA